MFQSTRPRGARPGLRVSSNVSASFNPRAREGRDPSLLPLAQSAQSFNPRAREGRDIGWTAHTFIPRAFQSTRPRGARQGCSAGR